MRIIFGAIISRHPFVPGSVWNRMQWAVGLRELGHEVIYLEEMQPKWCVDATGRPSDFAGSVNRLHFAYAMKRFGFEGSSCQLYNGGEATTGMSREQLAAAVNGADLLINQSGHVTSDLVLDGVKRRLYVDQDPLYTQLWHSEYGKDLGFSRHDAFCTVGLNIGTQHSPVPAGEIAWRHTLPPVVPGFWEVDDSVAAPAEAAFTTVASLSGYGDLQYGGEWYRGKYDHLRHFADLPRRADARLEVLLKEFEDDNDVVRALRAGGWRVRRSADLPENTDLDGYRKYIQQSRGEIGIAKGAYVKSRSGWFSDRTACYLASGRPCLVQSTGFERRLSTGQGLLTFETMDQAVAGFETINRDYRSHCRAARAWAAEYLDYRKVLPAMLEAGMRPAELVGDVS